MDITARAAVGAVWVPLGGGIGTPSPVIATGTHGDYDIELTLTVQPAADGFTKQLACSSLVVRQRPGGPPVTTVGLRALTMAQLVRDASAQVVGPRRAATVVGATATGTASSAPGHVQVGDTADVTDDVSWTMTSDGGHVRAQGPTDENLRLVADIYRQALAARGRPTVAVQTTLGLPRGTAGDWIRLARVRGFLSPSQGRGKAAG